MDDRDRRIAKLEGEVAELKRLVAVLLAENAELKARLNKNSTNSSKPPSSDGPGTAARPTKPLSGRRPVGQPGHKPDKRELYPLEQVSRVVEILVPDG